jgi:hypothetical protein
VTKKSSYLKNPRLRSLRGRPEAEAAAAAAARPVRGVKRRRALSYGGNVKL